MNKKIPLRKNTRPTHNGSVAVPLVLLFLFFLFSILALTKLVTTISTRTQPLVSSAAMEPSCQVSMTVPMAECNEPCLANTDCRTGYCHLQSTPAVCRAQASPLDATCAQNNPTPTPEPCTPLPEPCIPFYQYCLTTWPDENWCIPSPTPPTPMPTLKCHILWWFDETHPTCSQKEFCGAYRYEGLETFTTERACQEALDMHVSPTPSPIGCTILPPSITLSPGQQTGIATQTLHYQLTVKNNNSQTCSPYTWTIESFPPDYPPETGMVSQWTTTDSPRTVTLASGEQTTLTVSVQPKSTVASGEYSFTVMTYDALGSAPIQSSAIYTVSSSIISDPPSWWFLIPNPLRNFLEMLYAAVFFWGLPTNNVQLLEGIPTPSM